MTDSDGVLLHPNCLLAVDATIASLNAGNSPSPKFFSSSDCSQIPYPRNGNRLHLSSNTHVITPENLCSSLDRTNCTPLISIMFIPDNVRIRFISKVGEHVAENGQYVLDSLHTKVKNNIWSRQYYNRNSYVLKDQTESNSVVQDADMRWTSLKKTDGNQLCTLNPHYSKSAQENVLVKGCPGLQKTNNNDIVHFVKSPFNCKTFFSKGSCGSVFQPIIKNVIIDNPDTIATLNTAAANDSPYINPNTNQYEQCGNQTVLRNNCTWEAPSYNNGSNNLTGFNEGAQSLLMLQNAILSSPFSSAQETKFNPCDCEFNPNQVGRNCNTRLENSNCNQPVRGGNIERIEVSLKDSFLTTQIKACTNQGKYRFMGIEISAYKQGSKICDEIMLSSCNNSSYVATSPLLQKACINILAEKELNVKYATTDFPIACFRPAISANTAPGVYLTSNMNKKCNISVCRQILKLTGNSILNDGYQSITCNDTIYSKEEISSIINDNSINVRTSILDESDSLDTNNLSVHSPQLGIEVWICIGLLVILIVLCIVFGVRKYLRFRKRQRIEF